MGRIIVFLVGLFILAIVVFMLYTITNIVIAHYKYRTQQKQKNKEMKDKVDSIEHEINDLAREMKNDSKKSKKRTSSANFKVCSNCAKRSYCVEYKEYVNDFTKDAANKWFAIMYPSLSNDRSGQIDGKTVKLIDKKTKSIFSEYASKLPESYLDTLDVINDRVEQIRQRTDDSSIENILSSYCDSIEKSTYAYVELLEAPVKTEAMVKTMEEIDAAVNGVPATLDAILASTYEKDSMKALIEAGALKAVIEHNKTMFSGDGNFISDKLVDDMSSEEKKNTSKTKVNKKNKK